MNKREYEILNHGWTSADYFQGCGTAHTRFEHVFTGAGANAAEAYHDAFEQIYMVLDDAPALKLPEQPRGLGITQRNRIPARASGDVYWYVSIRCNGTISDPRRKMHAVPNDPVPCSGCGEFDFCVCASLAKRDDDEAGLVERLLQNFPGLQGDSDVEVNGGDLVEWLSLQLGKRASLTNAKKEA